MNNDEWMKNVLATMEDISACWNSINHDLVDRGSDIPSLTSSHRKEYLNGQFLFSQIQNELEDSLLCIRELANEECKTEQFKRVLLGKLARHQRALFEALVILIPLSHPDVWASKNTCYYLLHLHLCNDKEAIRHIQTDITDFGNVTNSRATELQDVQSKINSLSSHVILSLCTWTNSTASSLSSAKDRLKSALQLDATPFEKAALGLAYAQLYGLTSKRIHFTMTALNLKMPDEVELRKSVEQTLALSICVVLRALMFFENGMKMIYLEGQRLRDKYETRCPEGFVEAVLGPAVVDDFVLVREIDESYFGFVTNVTNPTRNWHYPVYEVSSLSPQVSRQHLSPSVSLVATTKQQSQLLADAQNLNYLTQPLTGNLQQDLNQAWPTLERNLLCMMELLIPLIETNGISQSLFSEENS